MRTTLLGAFAAGALVACTATTSTGDSTPPTPVPTIAVATTTTLEPLRAGPVADWGGLLAGEVCVVSEQSYPQVPDHRFDIEGLLRDLLEPSGIVVLAAGDPCLASLTIVMSLEGRPAEYSQLGTVYTGMLRSFDMTFRFAEAAPLNYHHVTDLQPGELATSFDPTDPALFLSHNERVWATIALRGLVQFWGPAVAIELLDDPTHSVAAFSQLCQTAGYELGACEPDGYDAWRAWYDATYLR